MRIRDQVLGLDACLDVLGCPIWAVERLHLQIADLLMKIFEQWNPSLRKGINIYQKVSSPEALKDQTLIFDHGPPCSSSRTPSGKVRLISASVSPLRTQKLTCVKIMTLGENTLSVVSTPITSITDVNRDKTGGLCNCVCLWSVWSSYYQIKNAETKSENVKAWWIFNATSNNNPISFIHHH